MVFTLFDQHVTAVLGSLSCSTDYIEAAQNNDKCAYHNFGEPVNFYKLASKHFFQCCNSLCVYDQVTINMHMCV